MTSFNKARKGKVSKEKYWYKVQDAVFSKGAKMSESEMTSYALELLGLNHKEGDDLSISREEIRDYPVNAWTYLKSQGVAVDTNRRTF